MNAIAEVSPPPAELESAAFVDWCMERFTQAKPLVDWLAEELGGERTRPTSRLYDPRRYQSTMRRLPDSERTWVASCTTSRHPL